MRVREVARNFLVVECQGASAGVRKVREIEKSCLGEVRVLRDLFAGAVRKVRVFGEEWDLFVGVGRVKEIGV